MPKLAELELHPAALNIMMLSCVPGSATEKAAKGKDAIEKLARIHTSSSRAPWLPSDKLPVLTEQDWAASLKGLFQPRLYAGLGAFDVLALYLAPIVGPPYPYADSILHSGKLLHACLLPKLQLRAEGKKPARPDFNRKFIESFSTRRSQPGSSGLPANQQRVLIAKLRFNSAVCWPGVGEPPDARVLRQLQQVARVVADWLADGPGEAAICLGFGWSELILVANSPSIGPLFQLLWQVRSVAAEVWWSVDGKPTRRAHTLATSMSVVGYDLSLLGGVQDFLQAKLDETPKRSKKRPLDPKSLPEWTEAILAKLQATEGPTKEGKVPELGMGVHFNVFPGHEAKVVDLIGRTPFNQLRLLPGIKAATFNGPGMAGRNDVAGPELLVDTMKGERAALVALALLRFCLLRDGKDPFCRDIKPASVGSGQGVLHYSSSETWASLSSLRSNRASKAWPKGHHNETAIHHEGALLLQRTLDHSIQSIVRSSRILQLSYSETEQLIHMIAKYSWTTNHDVFWDEGGNLGTLVFCLRDHLRDVEEWWLDYSLEPAGVTPRVESPFGSPERARAEFVQKRLRSLRRQQENLLRAFRANFNYRFVGGYLSDHNPDLNLRHLGSVQQILNVAAMTLDSLVAVVPWAEGLHRKNRAVIRPLCRDCLRCCARHAAC